MAPLALASETTDKMLQDESLVNALNCAMAAGLTGKASARAHAELADSMAAKYGQLAPAETDLFTSTVVNNLMQQFLGQQPISQQVFFDNFYAERCNNLDET